MGKRDALSRASVVLLCVAASFVVSNEAEAAPFTVTSLVDTAPDGCSPTDCTLREAIQAAEAAAGEDTILLQTDQTYVLSLVSHGDLDVSTPITIRGRDATIVAATNWQDRLFQVAATGDLTIESVTLTDGNAVSGADGGAIKVSGKASLDNVVLENNHTTGQGAAIFSDESADLSIIDSVVRNNISEASGGGLAINGSATIVRTGFVGNAAVAFGGALRLHALAPGAISITDSNFDGNTADADGGAILSTGNGQVTITGSTFTDNEATGTNTGFGSSGDGGAINVGFGARMTITSSTLHSNQTFSRGGAIFNLARLEVSHSTLSDNEVSGVATTPATGGGIHSSTATFEVHNSTFSGNRAEDGGGGLFATETGGTVTNSTFTRNIANNDSSDTAGDGGGVAGQPTNLIGSIVFGNTDEGGANDQDNCGGGGVDSDGGNVLGLDGACPVGEPGDSSEDPGLGPLQDNGGPTLTHAIAADSSALNINDEVPECGGTDQRGAPRPAGADCDAGSYELVHCRGSVVNVVGTSRADRLSGTPASDAILALEGDDTVSGGDGDDRICGGDGRDRLVGAGGKDVLDGGPMRDGCNGGPGRDRFFSCENARR